MNHINKLGDMKEWHQWRDENPDVRPDLFRANLCGAYLSGANLSRANLFGANLSRADLSRAYLSRANLSGANLSGANLSRANLYGANLRGAEGIVRATGDGWEFFAVRHEDGLRIHAGCHWFTEAQAYTHWAGPSNHDRISIAAVKALVIQAKERGWVI